jgi:hypothetical protein
MSQYPPELDSDEFRCKLDKDTYLVYINAETGEEEEVKNTGIIGNCGMIDLCGWQREEMTFEAVNLDETLGDY